MIIDIRTKKTASAIKSVCNLFEVMFEVLFEVMFEALFEKLFEVFRLMTIHFLSSDVRSISADYYLLIVVC